ncbi:hypothetical protein DLAC_04907 [Tieghemostelium lacteum]|uniref:IPT/TIG domain-containing protein n=1 Tax=Tieghemostelium lacteum TaxID=361077 RepID=A0A151ZJ30_TIELA|nr:hypothetical protein DLAC_04907 [Tieghemostelium lacteum]|eukprot:KYQ94008.1 hypothetical protein DLAC_04907 [Tieghemostelium lacteum]
MKIIFVFLLVFFIYGLNGEFNPSNGHYYYKTPLTKKGSEAQTICQNTPYSTFSKGYLAKINTESEFNWITSTFGGELWVNGIDSIVYNANQKYGEIYYDNTSNPFNLFYSVKSDKCYTYCPWHSTEPNYLSGEYYTSLKYDSVQYKYYYFNTPDFILLNVLCEYSALPEVSRMDDTGTVQISGLSTAMLSDTNLKVTFKKGSSNYTCTKTTIANNNYNCKPAIPGTGTYTIVITSLGITTTVLDWIAPPPVIHSIKVPTISYIDKSLTNGMILTITGSTFGTDASKIQIRFSVFGSNSCFDIKFLSDIVNYGQQITCTLSWINETSRRGLLPIKITVDGVATIGQRTPIYWNDKFYTGFPYIGQFNFALNHNMFYVDNKYYGVPAVFTNVEKKSLFATFFPPAGGKLYTDWSVWQPVYFTSIGFFYFVYGHPQSQQKAFLTYTGSPSYDNYNINYLIQLYTGALSYTSPGTYPTNGVVYEYGNGKTLLNVIRVPPAQPSSGLNSTFRVSDVGHAYTPVSVTIETQPSIPTTLNIVRNFASNYIYVVFPPLPAGTYRTSLTIESSSYIFQLNYLIPKISSVVAANSTFLNSIPTSGIMTITGENFYTRADLLNVKIGDVNCTNVFLLEPHTKILCTISGSLVTPTVVVSIFSQNVTRPSVALSISFDPPVIQFVNIVDPVAKKITINGRNFGEVVNDLKVTIGPDTLVCVITNPHYQLQCDVPYRKGNHSLQVSVKNRLSNFYRIQYTGKVDSVWVDSNHVLQVSGLGLGIDGGGLMIYLGTDTLTCVGNDTLLACTLPPLSTSNYLSILGFVETPPLIPIKIIPEILDYAPKVVDTEGGNITISGRFFGNLSYGLPSYLSVYSEFSPINYQYSNNTFIAYVPPGIGKNKVLSVECDNQLSSVTFSYKPPNITKIYQEDKKIAVIGDSFGTLQSELFLIVNSKKIYELNLNNPSNISFVYPLENLNGSLALMVGSQKTEEKDLPPIILSATPGKRNQSSFITVKGLNFPKSMNVTIGGKPCDISSVPTSVELVCIFYGNDTPDGPLKVQIQSGLIASYNTIFNYTTI